MALMEHPAELESDALLADGTVGHIRPIRPGDAGALVCFHEQLSSETVYRRFFGAHRHLRREEIERFTTVDYRDRLALIAEVDGCLAAVARYDRLPGADRAEVAFVVADSLQRHGLGTLLLEHLTVAARRRGVAAFEAQTLATNHPMQDVFRLAGFDCRQRFNAGVVDVSFPIAPRQEYLESVVGRDTLAVRARLRSQLGPIPRGDLAVVCRTAATGEAVTAACQREGIGLSIVVVTGELGIDLSAGLAYLAAHDEAKVIALESADVVFPRRLVALAREASRHRPVVTLLPPGGPAGWCEQAGTEWVHGVEELAHRIGEFLLEVGAGTWRPRPRGRLVEVPGCDPSGARAILDVAAASGPRHGPGSRRLEPPQVLDLLAAYGISNDLLGLSGTPGDWSLTLEDHPGDGLRARVDSGAAGTGQGLARVLPLTDRDAEELAHASAPAGRIGVAPLLLRASRLIDDQADVSRIWIPLGQSGMAGDRQVEVWTGPVRGTDDDPFVRRLPRPPSGPAAEPLR